MVLVLWKYDVDVWVYQKSLGINYYRVWWSLCPSPLKIGLKDLTRLMGVSILLRKRCQACPFMIHLKNHSIGEIRGLSIKWKCELYWGKKFGFITYNSPVNFLSSELSNAFLTNQPSSAELIWMVKFNYANIPFIDFNIESYLPFFFCWKMREAAP